MGHQPVLESKDFASSVLDALSSNICVVDKRGVIVAINKAWKNFALANPPGSGRSDIGVDYLAICRKAEGPGSDGARKFGEGLRDVLDGKRRYFEMEYPCSSPDKYRWFSGHITPMRHDHGGAVISHRDITDRKLLEFKLVKLAATDSLTGLPNRRYFVETSDLEVERINRFGGTASLIIVDLDRFKSINDTYGHAGGDEALRCVAHACEGRLRRGDILARIGGEEFALMLPGTHERGALVLAEKLRKMIEDTRVPNARGEFSITASFGIAEIRTGDKGVVDALHRADTALYAAKKSGRNRVTGFQALQRHQEA